MQRAMVKLLSFPDLGSLSPRRSIQCLAKKDRSQTDHRRMMMMSTGRGRRERMKGVMRRTGRRRGGTRQDLGK